MKKKKTKKQNKKTERTKHCKKIEKLEPSKLKDKNGLVKSDLKGQLFPVFTKFQSQGCALTAPGHLRQLTVGPGRPKIYSWSPSRATCWCWFPDLQSKSKKKMLFNLAHLDIQRSFHVNSCITLSSTLIVTSCTVFDFNSFSKWHYNFSFIFFSKEIVTSALTGVKYSRRLINH